VLQGSVTRLGRVFEGERKGGKGRSPSADYSAGGAKRSVEGDLSQKPTGGKGLLLVYLWVTGRGELTSLNHQRKKAQTLSRRPEERDNDLGHGVRRPTERTRLQGLLALCGKGAGSGCQGR